MCGLFPNSLPNVGNVTTISGINSAANNLSVGITPFTLNTTYLKRYEYNVCNYSS